MFLIVVFSVAAVACAAGYRAFVGRRRVTRAEYVALRRAEDASAWEAAQDRIAAKRAE